MDQPARLQHVDSSVLRPLIQLVPVHALVCRSVSNRDPVGRAPLECDEPDVAVAHGALAKEIDTML